MCGRAGRKLNLDWINEPGTGRNKSGIGFADTRSSCEALRVSKPTACGQHNKGTELPAPPLQEIGGLHATPIGD